MPETTEAAPIRRSPEELTQLFYLLEQRFVDGEGEIAEDTQTLIDLLDLSEKDFVDRYASFMRHLEARAEGFEADAARYAKPLLASAASAKNLVRRLKARALQHLQQTDRKELKGDLFKFSRQKSPEALMLTPAGEAHHWPAEFYRPAPLDKEKLKAHVKALGGEAVSSDDEPVLLARIDRGEHVRIYP